MRVVEIMPYGSVPTARVYLRERDLEYGVRRARSVSQHPRYYVTPDHVIQALVEVGAIPYRERYQVRHG